MSDRSAGEFAYDYVGTDPELRLHRVSSKPTLSSGDVLEDVVAGDSDSTEKVSPNAQGNAHAGGGRVDA